ncbi:DUF3667 domain-containing protein [Flavobacterium sp. RSB2_4_14]|uniref:DUF3667 domain-containing protein n=1 Tax=Flavobacterium sp. RSB2_4_14 TaxID=3447665 RepID=UPI003F36B06F
MSKSSLRKDKTCLNCRYVVENRFCPNCGQENTDTRKTFYHLFVHFFEDLTHYENAFWKTIKNLLLKPAALTKEYLSGKRLSYLAPIRLYIFISFVTFFIIAVFPNETNSDFININNNTKNNLGIKTNITVEKAKLKKLVDAKVISQETADELLKTAIKLEEEAIIKEEKDSSFIDFGYKTFEELEEHKNEMGPLQYALNKKTIPIYQKYTYTQIKEKFVESVIRNFPKILIIYMPLFAFVLWLFHGKKRWYYFDHGIFTLHYFSFLLLIYLLLFLFNKIIDSFVVNTVTNTISSVVNFIGYLWMIYYFFPAHRRFYEESRFVSIIKTSSMFFINLVLISIIMIFYIVYSFINIH